jgi:transposase InsO family protein
MAQHGGRCRVVRRYPATTNSRDHLPVAANVLAPQFVATRPHQVWMGDITDLPTDEGGWYRASLEDLDTRKIVGGAAGARMTQDLTLAALHQAGARYRPADGVLHHADRGSQYAAHADPARLAHYHRTGSMSRTGNCGDHACLESWPSLLKTEGVDLHHCRTRAEAIAVIFEVHRDLLQPAPAPRGTGVPDPGRSGSGKRGLVSTHLGVSKFLTQIHTTFSLPLGLVGNA